MQRALSLYSAARNSICLASRGSRYRCGGGPHPSAASRLPPSPKGKAFFLCAARGFHLIRLAKRATFPSRGRHFACGRGPHPSAASRLPPVSLRLGPAAASLCHRHVIHYRGARFARPKGKAFFLCAARGLNTPAAAERCGHRSLREVRLLTMRAGKISVLCARSFAVRRMARRSMRR